MKTKFSEKAYLVTAISIFVTVIMTAVLFSEELGDSFSEYPRDESIYWVGGLILLVGFALLFGIFFIVSWKRERVEKNYTKRKCCAVFLLVVFLPLAIGLPIYT